MSAATWDRPADGRLLGGVCAGLALRWNVPAGVIRLAFALLAFASGVGVIVYVALWLVTPAEGERDAPAAGLRDLLRGNARELRGAPGRLAEHWREAWDRADDRVWPKLLTRRWTAMTLIALGGVVTFWSIGLFAWLRPVTVLGLLALIGGGALLLVDRGRRAG